jgi:hypothetical protein
MLPDVRDHSADLAGFVSAINVHNPDRIFGTDPLGTNFVPDYAARFSGFLKIETAGHYEFALTVDEGARVRLNGLTLFDISGVGIRQEMQRGIDLDAGLIPIEVLYYAGVQTSDVRLSFRRLDTTEEMRVVAPEMVIPHTVPVRVMSDESGVFVLRDVPTHVGAIGLTVSHSEGTTRHVVGIPPPGSTDVGDVTLGPR